MQKKTKYGKIAVNARVNVKYENNKPTVKFGYPRRDAFKQNRGTIFPLIMLFNLVILLFFINYGYPIFFKGVDYYPRECKFLPHYNGTEIRNITMTCDNDIEKNIIFIKDFRTENQDINYMLEFFGKYNAFISDSGLSSSRRVFLTFLFFLFLIIFGIVLPVVMEIPLLKLALKTAWFKRKIPLINRIGGEKYRAVFKKVPDNLQIEIPLFYNVALDYQATKDFSRYLKEIDVREHPFNKVLVRKGKIKKKQKNIRYWRGIFSFSQKPQTGKLEVLFR